MKRATVVLAVLLAATGVIAGTASAGDATPAADVRLQALDREILTHLNAIRVKHRLRPLVLSDALEKAAVAHSRAMLERGFFEHSSHDGSPFSVRVKRFYRAAGYGSWSVGENLLYSTAEMDAATAVETWLDSPTHRKNMLAPDWREVGIGALHAISAGGTFDGKPTWVITMDFGARSGAGKSATPAATLNAGKGKPGMTVVPHAKPARPLQPNPKKPVKRRVDRVLPMPT